MYVSLYILRIIWLIISYTYRANLLLWSFLGTKIIINSFDQVIKNKSEAFRDQTDS